jgi:NhaP-type Na+/H+ or K+/H+ antiporter
MHGLFPDLVFVSCLAIAACLTPTDPIICATIVGAFLIVTIHMGPFTLLNRRKVRTEARSTESAAHYFR